jgi:plastocyanin
MPRLPRRLAIGMAAVLLLSAVSLLAACSGTGAPSASIDPNAPSLTATGQKFDTTELDVPADTAFDLVLHNDDAVQHNVSIYSDEGHTQRVFGGEFANTGTHVYHVQALAPATYYFQCDIHPSMNGIVVTGSG